MDPILFSIACPTCQRTLIVRDEAAIGAILPCGRCGSMVHVVPPAGWRRPKPAPPPVGASAPATGTLPAAASASSLSVDTPSGTVGAEPASGRADQPAPQEGAGTEAPVGIAAGTTSPPLPGPPPVVEQPVVAKRVQTLAWADAARGWLSFFSMKALLAGAAAVAMLAGGATLLVWQASPSQQGEASMEIAAALAEPVPIEAQPGTAASATPPIEPLKGRRWLPAQTRCVVGLRLADLCQLPWADRLLQAADPVWAPTAGRLMRAFDLQPQDVRQLIWAVADLNAWPAKAVVLVELEGEQGAARWRQSGQPCTLEAGGLAWRQLTGNASWPHPFALLDERTLITGTPELLAEFSGGNPPPLASKPIERLLQVAAWDGHFVLLDLEAARQAGWTRAVQWLDVWPAGREAWQTLWNLPQGMGLRVQPQQAPEGTAVAVCQGLSTAEKVRLAVEQLLPASCSAIGGLASGIAGQVRAGRLPAALAERYESLLKHSETVLRAARCEVVEADVFVRFDSQPHLAPLAEAALDCPAAVVNDWLAAGMALDETNHARLVGGLRAHAKAEGRFPPGAGGGTLLPPSTRLSWIALALPYLDRRDWRRELDPAYSWNSPHNRPVSQRRLETVINPLIPQQTTEAGFPVTHYVGVAGWGADAADLPASDPRAGMFGFARTTRPEDLARGASNTLAVLGVVRDLGPWAAGGQATVRPLTQRPYVNGPDGFGSGQPHGMLAGMADGSVRFISKDMDPAVLEQLATLGGAGLPHIARPDPPQTIRASAKPTVSLPQGGPKGADTLASPPLPGLAATPIQAAPESGAAPPPETAASKPTADKTPSAPPKLPPDAEDQEPPLDIEARLADMVPGIRFNSTPLIKAVRLLSQMSAIPIAFDFEALNLAGATLQDPITLELADAPLGEVLKAVLATRRLDFAVQKDHLLVTGPAAERAQLRTEAYAVGDLVSGPAGADELAGQIRRLVAPETWREAGGAGIIAARQNSVEVTQIAGVHHQIRAFLGKLRAARTRPPASVAQVLATRYDLLRQRLRQPITSNFIQPEPWVRILADLEQLSRTPMVVDWAAVGAAGVRPNTPATLRANEEPLSEAMVSLLQPLGLTYRIAAPDVLEVTTRKAVAARLELEFYSVRDLVGPDNPGEALANRVKAQIAPESWNEAGGPGVLVFDAPSACLIVLQSQHTQVRIELLLARWTAEALQLSPPATAPAVPSNR